MNTMKQLTEALYKIDVIKAAGVVGGKTHLSLDQTTITGRSFLSGTTLPDVQPNTKILAVCGINDWNDLAPKMPIGCASPSSAGWFFSDFFFLHHVLKNVSSDQEWLLCERPKDLVERYTEYVQAFDRNDDEGRRVVMDESMLNQVDDMEVVTRSTLLERFLEKVTRAVSQAEKENRHLLVLVLSHGNNMEDNYSILMGGEDPNDPDCPHLEMRDFKRALMDGLQPGRQDLKRGLCLLTSACFSGGWAINPELNITTIMAGADNTKHTLSWPLSGTLNQRCCGSPWASSIAQVLLQMTVEDFGNDDRRTYLKSPTYAGFVQLVKNELLMLDERSGEDVSVHSPMFSAAGDEWEMQYSTRTGIPLGDFRSRWELLKPSSSSRKSPASDNEDLQLAPGERPLSYEQIFGLTKRHAESYRKSHPDPGETDNNRWVDRLTKYILDHSGRPPFEELKMLYHALDYRLNVITAAATQYKNALGLKIEDCHLIDAYGQSLITPNFGPNWSLVLSYHLFDTPSPIQGQPYYKGITYLAVGLARSGWSIDQVAAKLDSLCNNRNPKIPDSYGYSIVPGTSRSKYTIDHAELKRVGTLRASIRNLVTSTGKQLRDLSPVKKRSRRSTIPSEWMSSVAGPSGHN